MAVTREQKQEELPFVRRTELIPVDKLYATVDQSVLDSLVDEDRRFERKSVGVHAPALGDYFSILANTAPDGGLLAVGIEDDGTLSGCLASGQKHVNELEHAADVYCPMLASNRNMFRSAMRKDRTILSFCFASDTGRTRWSRTIAVTLGFGMVSRKGSFQKMKNVSCGSRSARLISSKKSAV